jgi:hypothetical protein
MKFSYEEDEGKGLYGLDSLQKGCGTDMEPKICDDEVGFTC